MNRRAVLVVPACALAALLAVASRPDAKPKAAARGKVAYPEGYRDWRHVKSMAILSPDHPLHAQFGGIHHVYANDRAAIALKEERAYPDGSVLVFDLLEAVEEDGTVQEGERKLLGVMVKDSKRHAATGGWAWEGFAGDSHDQRLVTDVGTQCFACHQQQASATDFVFSTSRD